MRKKDKKLFFDTFFIILREEWFEKNWFERSDLLLHISLKNLHGFSSCTNNSILVNVDLNIPICLISVQNK